ncbi:hypothetical protein BH09BAC3_BH09BAC3_20150 [soil metagenome]
MKFLSIKEYFYKLNTIGFIVLLLPITTFIFLYLVASKDAPILADWEDVRALLIVASVLLVLDLTIVHWVYRVRLEKMKSFLELAKRMDGFYTLTLMRLGAYCGCAIAMGFGYYLTHHHIFTGLFGLMLLITIIQRPTRALFCREFDLTKNEREMIMSGGDLITKK